MRREALPIRTILPGLICILLIDLVAWMGIGANGSVIATSLLILLPWVTLLFTKRSPATIGYVRERAVARYGWGMVAGGVWRGLSMGFNYLILRPPISLGSTWTQLISSLILVPFVEETFYRGYLGRSLAKKLGRWPGIIIQATLFTLYPIHWNQGWPAIASIFGFGVLSGWLVERTGSIWIGWGAHGFANILPVLLLNFV